MIPSNFQKLREEQHYHPNCLASIVHIRARHVVNQMRLETCGIYVSAKREAELIDLLLLWLK